MSSYAKRNDVLFIVEEKFHGKELRHKDYSYRYTIVVKCLRIDNDGRLTYECQYVEKIRRDITRDGRVCCTDVVRAHTSGIITFHQRSLPSMTLDNLEQVLKIIPYTSLAREYKECINAPPQNVYPDEVLYSNVDDNDIRYTKTEITRKLVSEKHVYTFTKVIKDKRFRSEIIIGPTTYESRHMLSYSKVCDIFRSMLGKNEDKPKRIDKSSGEFTELDNEYNGF